MLFKKMDGGTILVRYAIHNGLIVLWAVRSIIIDTVIIIANPIFGPL